MPCYFVEQEYWWSFKSFKNKNTSLTSNHSRNIILISCYWKQAPWRQFKQCTDFDWLWTNVCGLFLFQRDCSGGFASCFLETGLTVSFVWPLVISASFLWLSFPWHGLPLKLIWDSILVNIVVYQGARKSFYLSFFLLFHGYSQDHHKYLCAVMCSEMEEACDLWGRVLLFFAVNLPGPL